MEDFLLLDQTLSSEERSIRSAVHNFVKTDVVPKITASYEQASFPMELIPRLAALGLFGMTLPTKYGGAGANYVSYGLACQELEYGDSSLRSFVSVQSSLAMYAIFAFGSEEQKQHWLPLMAKGEVIGCFALTEAEAGSDPSSMKTSAMEVNGGWELSGSKRWCTNATIADVIVVWAKTADGIQGFLVEKNSEGLTTTEIKHKMALRSSISAELELHKCKIPASHYLPGTKKGIASALECLTQARYGIAWGAIGAAMACYDSCLDYCKTRKQFDKPIASFQLVQKDLVDMFSEIVKAQALNLQIGRLKDSGHSNYAMVSMAKMNACTQALSIARKARNLLGANGITLDYPVIRHMANLEAVSTYEGTDNIHHLILGRYLTGIKAFD